ncbi:hypothetical protein K502DRAFT_357441 [Neoconidiobolus thromboides FSU 785]|nr:hypothetical protein K502DRAFT_357441 [Neoconidiobolus thromboides FSU 785]
MKFSILILLNVNSIFSAYTGVASSCVLPDDDSIVAITPNQANGGWAMSPDQTCTPGKWCPYSCKPGMVMNQWDPSVGCTDGAKCATMNGGLFCNGKGQLEKPFPNRPLCSQGAGTVKLVNKLSGSVSACQTVFPGNEAMLISTVVGSGGQSTIAVPPSTYWQKTSAHYYLNLPGSGQDECRWGDSSKPVGNWAPYVMGANQDENGVTFASATTNPLFKEVGFSTKGYTIQISCEGSSCSSSSCSVGQGGSSQSCIVSAGQGSTIYVTLM